MGERIEEVAANAPCAGSVEGYTTVDRGGLAADPTSAEQIHASLDLDESQAQLRLAIEAAQLGMFHYDRIHRELQWSARVGEMLGLPPGTPSSTERLLAAIHPDDAAKFTEIQRAICSATPGLELHFDFRIVRPDGRVRHLDGACRASTETIAEDGSPVRIVGTLRDTTTSKETEADLQKKVDERTAELREKTDQLEAFCYTVAHDLRAPLRAIAGYAEMLRAEKADALGSDGTARVDTMIRAAARLDQLIRDLLAYNRIEHSSTHAELVSLSSPATWAVNQLAAEIGARGAQVVVEETMPQVRADPAMLEAIALNLISNALKFVPPDRTPQIHVFAIPRGDKVRFAVRDNGIGIPPQYHQRIFRVFERLNHLRDAPGTGVGLAIVQRATARLGGRVALESEPGVGSTFWVELDAAAAP